MAHSILIYSLSAQIRKLNPRLTSHIIVIHTGELIDILYRIKPSSVLFEIAQLATVLNVINNHHAQKTHFICIGKTVNSGDKLLLQKNNIEFITPKNFITSSPRIFKIGSKKNLYKILVLEHDKTQDDKTKQILENAHITVMSVTKNEQIIETLDCFQADLILINLNMKGAVIDKLIKFIRTKDHYRFIPIVILTSNTTIQYRMEILNAGADDVFVKPVISYSMVSSLIRRMQKNILFHTETKKCKPEPDTANNNEIEQEKLYSFLTKNKNNRSASIIWIKAKNKQALQKKIGYLGFKKLCKNMFANLPMFSQNFNIKLKLTDGVFALASGELNREQAQIWVIKLQKWISKNNFSINKKYYYFDIAFVILSNIHIKKNKRSLIQKAENLLIDPATNQDITFLDESRKEEYYYLIKKQLENAIRTKKFKWLYHPIISTIDESQESYKLMLHIITDSGNELTPIDYFEVADRIGHLRLLNRYALDYAIKTIKTGQQKKIETRILLNQVLSDFQTQSLRDNKFNLIRKHHLPAESLMFQFSLEDAQEHMGVLVELSKKMNQKRIKICLSNFDCSNIAWKIARKLNANWIKLRPFDSSNPALYVYNLNHIAKTVRKAHILGYKVFTSRIDDVSLAADLWKLDIDYLQGDFIQNDKGHQV